RCSFGAVVGLPAEASAAMLTDVLIMIAFAVGQCLLPLLWHGLARYGFDLRFSCAGYLSWSLTLSMPACAQTSSLSPPGAPETPTPPIVSSPIMIGSAPRAATTLASISAPATGFWPTFSANLPEGVRKVRAV